MRPHQVVIGVLWLGIIGLAIVAAFRSRQADVAAIDPGPARSAATWTAPASTTADGPRSSGELGDSTRAAGPGRWDPGRMIGQDDGGNGAPGTGAAPVDHRPTTSTTAIGSIESTSPARTSTVPATTAPATTVPPAVGPVAVEDRVDGKADKDLKAKVLDNDVAGDAPIDAESITIVAAPASAESYRIHGDHIHYRPADGFAGVDRLDYEVCDAEGHCSRASVVFTIG